VTTPHRTPTVRVCLARELRALATKHDLNLSALLHDAVQAALRALGEAVDVPHPREGRPTRLRVGDVVAWSSHASRAVRAAFGATPAEVTAILPRGRISIRAARDAGGSLEGQLHERYLMRAPTPADS
jgi:hypothetical protein